MDKRTLDELLSKFSSDHPLIKYKNKPYYIEFEKLICSLQLNNAKLDLKIEELLNDNGNFSIYKYNQGISELLIWFLLEQRHLNYQIEKKINKTQKDVDVVISIGDAFYNVEVKSPEYEERKEKQISGIIANRSTNKEIFNIANDIKSLISQQLSVIGYEKVDIEYPKDNKVKDTLLSAQSKFNNNNSKNCNVLYLSTNTNEFVKYLNYIVNSESGFFTPNSYVKHSEYNKVMAIVLTNAISLNHKFDKNSWDVSKAITLILHNPFCETQNFTLLEKLFEIIPNQTHKFCEGLREFRKQQFNNEDPLPEYSYYIDFVASEGYNLNNEK
ncbi:MAG: hypothetical protein IKL82_06620 [Clostridia bacterium]|nr:hypothetical protein [Clostridia bacterium]